MVGEIVHPVIEIKRIRSCCIRSARSIQIAIRCSVVLVYLINYVTKAKQAPKIEWLDSCDLTDYKAFRNPGSGERNPPALALTESLIIWIEILMLIQTIPNG